jgi:hypothetical protein
VEEILDVSLTDSFACPLNASRLRDRQSIFSSTFPHLYSIPSYVLCFFEMAGSSSLLHSSVSHSSFVQSGLPLTILPLNEQQSYDAALKSLCLISSPPLSLSHLKSPATAPSMEQGKGEDIELKYDRRLTDDDEM